jgi:hypothetical protein
MPPTTRFVVSFAAEPPHEAPPYGRWAQTLYDQFMDACHGLRGEDGEDIGEAGEVAFYPDRTYHGRTYIPASALTTEGYELFGYVAFSPGAEDQPPTGFGAHADVTSETAERNPDWQLDVSDEVIGQWRGENGAVADMTLMWGVPLVSGGTVVTAELADLAVDQCEVLDGRFTLIAPDAYRQDYLEIKLWDARGRELARESLYVDDEDGTDEEA